jgi:hypothetical protein
MRELIKRFARQVKGCITGFDRIVFKGWILPLCTAKGAMDFCRANKILFKEYKTWMMKQTRCLVDYADQYAKANCGQGVIHIPTYRVNKEELARRLPNKLNAVLSACGPVRNPADPFTMPLKPSLIVHWTSVGRIYSMDFRLRFFQ